MAELPTGPVTYLFTDVVGSGALWDEAPVRLTPGVAGYCGMMTWSPENPSCPNTPSTP